MSGLARNLAPADRHVESYYAATSQVHVQCPAFVADATTDVCVIGGGYAGLGTALHLSRRGIPVTVLEQSRLGWGASGRNGGQVHVGLRQDQFWLERHVGDVAAHRFWELGLQAREHLDWVSSTYGVDCRYRPGLVHAIHKPRYVNEARDYADHLQRHYGYQSLRFMDRDELRCVLDSPGYFGGTYDTYGGHLHALDWALGIARAGQSHGALLHEGVEVTGLRREGDGFRVMTSCGSIRARRVVLAGNGYLRGLAPAVQARVMPINNFIAVTAPLGADATQLIRNGAAVSDSRFVVNYFRVTTDERLLFGGGENYSYRFPADIAGFVRPHIERVFPQLRGVAIDYAWGGTLGITATRMPYVREVEPGIVNLSGFSGLGVLLAPYAGKLVADALAGDHGSFDLLSSLAAPPFPGGPWLRWPTLVAAMLYYALRDRL